MRLRPAAAGLRNAEIAILRIGAQTIGFEILVAIMADGDALFRASAPGGGLRPRLGLAIFGLDLLSRCGFGGGFARRRFLLCGGAGRGPRGRLLLGHRRSPFPFDEERIAQLATSSAGQATTSPPGSLEEVASLGGLCASAPLPPLDQCSRHTPSKARSSAGLISLECATVTANSGPSSFCCQNERKSFSAGKFGNRSQFC